MKTHDGDYKGFSHLSRAWYGKANLALERDRVVDCVHFGFYSPEGGTSREMTMEWVMIDKPTPRLKVFNDAWHTLYQFQDVLQRLAEVDDQHISPEDFCAILRECGFQDDTKEER